MTEQKGFDLLHDARQLRNGPIKRHDIRKVEGKNLYLDLIARRPIKIIDTYKQLGFSTPDMMDLFYATSGLHQITQLAANNILWGEKWPGNEA